MRRPHYDVGRPETAAMDAETNKGAWSKQEDEKLVSYIRKHGEGCWRTLPQAAGLLRCGKSCRLRWVNYLKPGLKRGNFSDDEEDLIVKLHALLGNRWSLIAGRLPGRTDNQVKNYWNTHLRRKLVKVGIDPNNHRLNQTLARPRRSDPPPKSDAGDCRLRIPAIPSKSSMRDEACSNADQVSDSGTCLLEDTINNSATNRELPDLNLDLNFGTTSVVKTGICNDPSMLFETPTSNSPTLLLFA